MNIDVGIIGGLSGVLLLLHPRSSALSTEMSRERSPPPPPSADRVERNMPRRDRPNPGPRVGSRSEPCTKRPGGDPPRSYRGG
ncbi:hypothetical protein FCV25MIE_26128 [Fagus crenata]